MVFLSEYSADLLSAGRLFEHRATQAADFPEMIDLRAERADEGVKNGQVGFRL